MSVATITPLPLRIPVGKKSKMVCPEWCVLVEKYAQAARSFSEATGAFPSLPGNGFDHAWERAERARKICEEARSALLRHEHSHDCASARVAVSAESGDGELRYDRGQPAERHRHQAIDKFRAAQINFPRGHDYRIPAGRRAVISVERLALDLPSEGVLRHLKM